MYNKDLIKIFNEYILINKIENPNDTFLFYLKTNHAIITKNDSPYIYIFFINNKKIEIVKNRNSIYVNSIKEILINII